MSFICREIYEFTKTASHYDNPPEVHLSLMCQGMWSRLAYLWSLRRAANQQKKRLNLPSEEVRTMFNTKPTARDEVCVVPINRCATGKRLFPDVAAILEVL